MKEVKVFLLKGAFCAVLEERGTGLRGGAARGLRPLTAARALRAGGAERQGNGPNHLPYGSPALGRKRKHAFPLFPPSLLLVPCLPFPQALLFPELKIDLSELLFCCLIGHIHLNAY